MISNYIQKSPVLKSKSRFLQKESSKIKIKTPPGVTVKVKEDPDYTCTILDNHQCVKLILTTTTKLSIRQVKKNCKCCKLFTTDAFILNIISCWNRAADIPESQRYVRINSHLA